MKKVLLALAFAAVLAVEIATPVLAATVGASGPAVQHDGGNEWG